MNQPFTFEVVTVDGAGEIVGQETHTAAQVVERLDGGASLEMVVIPAGAFLMGSRAGQGYDDERPQHSVRIRSFLMGKVPVTQEQWRAVMGRLPPCRCPGARRPVDRVSWDD
jgi:formylglycine-generating enzyme required for sulfatase activity